MAIFRKIHVSFWSDSFVSALDVDKKLFYIYLLTNERTKQCGVYEITIRQMSFDTGFSFDKISKLIKYFISAGKIKYNTKTSEIGVGNWLKYNNSTSPKVQSCINKEFESVKDTLLIEYVKSIGTLSQEEQEEEQEEEEEEEEEQESVFSSEIHACLKNCLLNFPKHLHPSTESKKNNWLDTIEKLNRIEMLPFESIEMIVKKTRADDFWAKNFLSITKLRKNNKDGIKFIVVFNESIKSNEKRNTNNNASGVSDAYMEQIYKDLSTGGRG